MRSVKIELASGGCIVNVGLFREEKGQPQNKSIRLHVPFSWGDENLRRAVLNHVEEKHPGWSVVGYAPASAPK